MLCDGSGRAVIPVAQIEIGGGGVNTAPKKQIKRNQNGRYFDSPRKEGKGCGKHRSARDGKHLQKLAKLSRTANAAADHKGARRLTAGAERHNGSIHTVRAKVDLLDGGLHHLDRISAIGQKRGKEIVMGAGVLAADHDLHVLCFKLRKQRLHIIRQAVSGKEEGNDLSIGSNADQTPSVMLGRFDQTVPYLNAV